VAAFLVAALAIALFSAMDALMKGLVLSLGAYNAMFFRTLAGIVLSGLVYALRKPRLPSRAALRFHVLRAAVVSVMALLFFWGLARVPMAQAIALAFVAPVIALFLAALVLGERVARASVYASLLAFLGVLVILYGQTQRPLGEDALLGAGAILLSALCYAWNIVLMRQQAAVALPLESVFYQSVCIALLYLPAAPFLATLPALEQLPALFAAAALATTSLSLLAFAYARAEASYLAPTEYSAFLWATLFGWLAFREVVSTYTACGAVLIVAGCVLSARVRRTPLEAVEAV
jgi:S-adenosylmethionine uptake transporter